MNLTRSYLLLCFALGCAEAQQAPQPISDVVASVGSRQFLEGDFNIDRSKIWKALTAQLSRNPNSNELAGAIENERVTQLVDWIYGMVLEHAADTFDIQVTNEDQRQELAAIYRNDDKVLDITAKTIQRLPLAWRKAKENPESEKQIYDDVLKDIMSYERWRRYLDDESGAETIRRLEKMEPPKKSDLYRTSDSLKRILIKRAVRERIAKGVTVTEEELRAEHKETGYDQPLDQMRNMLASIVLERKRERTWTQWLRQQVEKSGAVIQDDRLRKRYDAYIKEAHGLEMVTSTDR